MTADGPPLAIIAANLRREREHRGLSLSEVAKRAGVAKSTLSQLESAQGNPSVETLWSLAVALDVPFSRLIEQPAASVRVLRRGEGVAYPSTQADFTGTLLSTGPRHVTRDIYVLRVEPGADRKAEAHIPGTVEHLIVCAGRFRSGPADEPVELGPGDYASFPGDIDHSYEALEPGSWAVLVMEHR
ncbi:helix-turn-helix domain-containing protein [Hamadaea tsunoensis]|uniref:helix-turn-helix domain-containing protein n=1 Tax=Hamadaea tsunoensis TaxID=53368 RepID=UPI000426C9EB|nr:XRE family transcriptional regulator [Hamadaea tsunoensis]